MFKKISEISDTKKGLYVVLILSLLIKMATLVIMHDMAINRDGTQYIAAAQEFAHGNFKEGFSFHRMPVYPLILMIINFIVRNWLVSARLISILSLTLAIIPLYLITRDLFGRRAAFWGSLAFALSPEINIMAMEVLRDPLFIFSLLWFTYFAQKAIREKTTALFFIAIIFSYIPFAFRIEGVILPFFYVLFIGCIFLIKLCNPEERKTYIKGLIVGLAISLVCILPVWWVIGFGSISLNKLDVLAQEIFKIKEFKFGQSYRNIYEQLKALEKMTYFSSGNQNFAEVARHYMPLIYMLGLFEVLIKNIFVFYLVPLIWGLRSKFSRSHIFVMTFAGFYILVIFYTYIERDFIQTRFLLPPAILFYPWIGLGIERILLRVKQSGKTKLLLAVCAFFFVLMPVGKLAKGMINEDEAIVVAAKWIRAQSEFRNVKFYANDSRIAFHAGWTREDFETVARTFNFQRHTHGITLGKFARANNIDLIVLRVRKKKLDAMPPLNGYDIIKQFKGRKKNIYIFCSPQICKNGGPKDS